MIHVILFIAAVALLLMAFASPLGVVLIPLALLGFAALHVTVDP